MSDGTEFAEQRRLIEAVIRVETMGTDITEIKATMGKVADALTRLAVMEERQQRGSSDLTRVFGRLDGHESRLNVLEQAQPLNKQTSEWVSKAIWAVVVAVLSAGSTLVAVSKLNETKLATVPTLTMPSK
jgi:hypothetical protein